MASKMVSKEYKTTRCGHCGKFGHHHSTHSKVPGSYHEYKEVNSPSKSYPEGYPFK